MKKLIVLASFGILLLSILSGGLALAIDEINPVYQEWSQWKPGTFVTYESKSETAGIVSSTEMTYTLKEVTPEKVVIELAMKTESMGVKVDMPSELLEFPAKGEGEDMLFEGDMTGGVDMTEVVSSDSEVKTGKTEEIEINGKKLTVELVEVITESSGQTLKSTVWVSEEVPGGMVKSLTEIEGPVPVKAEMVVTDYEIIK